MIRHAASGPKLAEFAKSWRGMVDIAKVEGEEGFV
jgi:hypothetical protein